VVDPEIIGLSGELLKIKKITEIKHTGIHQVSPVYDNRSNTK